jgi:putative FmdB family regulatory protein
VPIYEFICQSCNHEFEQIQSFSDNSVPACAKCGSNNVVRRVGRPAIHFKGSGWYITDSKKSGDKSAGKESSSGKSATESASTTAGESAGESKVETKTETKSESSTESKSTPAPVASD